MDKLKDLLYDFSDILLGAVIAIGMFVVISFSLGGWFNDGDHTVVAASEFQDSSVESTSPSVSLPELPEVESEADDSIEPPDEEVSDEPAELDEEIEPPAETPVEQVVVDDNPATVEMKQITIPNGTPGVGIAGILVDEGLIEDRQVFIQLAEELNLALRLKSGTFTIPVDASVEEMIRIIAGVN